MAEDAKGKNKKMIGIVVAAVVVIAGIVAAILLFGRGRNVDDDFFKSDDTKYVLTAETAGEGEERTHSVLYYNSEDQITKWETYYEYTDEDAAKRAYDHMKERKASEEDNKEKISLSGKYIIVELDKSVYENTSASTYKAAFENAMKNVAPVEEEPAEEPAETEENSEGGDEA